MKNVIFLFLFLVSFSSCEDGNQNKTPIKEEIKVHQPVEKEFDDSGISIKGNGVGFEIGEGVYFNSDGTMGIDAGGGVIINSDGSLGFGF